MIPLQIKTSYCITVSIWISVDTIHWPPYGNIHRWGIYVRLILWHLPTTAKESFWIAGGCHLSGFWAIEAKVATIYISVRMMIIEYNIGKTPCWQGARVYVFRHWRYLYAGIAEQPWHGRIVAVSHSVSNLNHKKERLQHWPPYIRMTLCLPMTIYRRLAVVFVSTGGRCLHAQI